MMLPIVTIRTMPMNISKGFMGRFLSRMSVERRVAQLFDFVGDIDALVGHDAFEDADAFLLSFGLGRILRGLFRRFVRDRGQLPFLELQVPAIHVDRKSTRLNSSH